jgi:hypothetical protein
MQSDFTSRRPEWALALVLGATLAGGCTTVKTTGTSRSGTEQLLLTGAWDSALRTVDFRPMAGRRVFLDSQYVTVVDKDWIISSIRRAMAEQGVLLENDKSKAQVIVEAAVGAYGTDDRSCTAGLPQVSLVPSLLGTAVASGANSSTGSGSSSSSSSALTLSQTTKQDAVVKAALFAYDAKSGEMVWESCPLLDAEGLRDHYVIGAGPYRNSSLTEVDQYPEEAQARTRRRLIHRLSGR